MSDSAAHKGSGVRANPGMGEVAQLKSNCISADGQASDIKVCLQISVLRSSIAKWLNYFSREDGYF